MGSRKMRFLMAKLIKTDLILLKDFLAAGKIVSVIDRRYPLSEAAEALRYLEEGHARGKIIIALEGSNKT
jgi:NADPH:quinone reductase-like Zn-dependent oxidoreductase